jgi:hypothetical protein
MDKKQDRDKEKAVQWRILKELKVQDLTARESE